MENFGALKAAVASAVARSDVPAYVYDLAANEIAQRFRLPEQEATATLSVSGETVALPANFMAVRSLWVEATPRTPLDPIDGFSAANLDGDGSPRAYSVEGDNLRLWPTPDGGYTLTLRYYSRPAAFVADTDTSALLTRYPGLWLYCALKHAAVWAQDAEMMQAYSSAYELEAQRVQRHARAALWGSGPLVSRRA